MSEIIVKLTDSRIKLKGGEYVRDLVRCKDCKYGKIDSLFCCEYECSVFGNSNVEADDFCSYGERADK